MVLALLHIPPHTSHTHTRAHILIPPPSLPCPTTSLAVFERLYEQAMGLRTKLEERRMAAVAAEEATLRASRGHMSWISAEMMRDRGPGPHGNYGEMLYAESQAAQARRREKVRGQQAR